MFRKSPATHHITHKKKKKKKKKKKENLLDEHLGAAELLDTSFWDLNSNNGTQMSTLLLWFFRCNYSLCQKSISHSTGEHARTVACYRAWGVSMRCTSSLSRNKCFRQTGRPFNKWTHLRQRYLIIIGELVLKGLVSDITSHGVAVGTCHLQKCKMNMLILCPAFSFTGDRYGQRHHMTSLGLSEQNVRRMMRRLRQR